ncbi:Spo0E family sporulation regulatory protein-aspartic acid phosphatase [Gottfriedia sp. NPDC057991]|uniref:Spo0E family sporulation regulatory protein-aspartic acid phosphatase n=1 Tax=Gottfriedia sp. NPDC057991 TaxID=3346298 RepID=UPI0036DAD479
MVTILQEQVILEIEEKRNELSDIYKRYGFLHYKTIQCSQELDKLLNQVVSSIFSLKFSAK